MAKQSIQNLFKGDLSRQQVDFDPVKKLEQSSRRVFDPYVGTKQILPADSGTNEVLSAMNRLINTYKGVQEKEVKAEEEARAVELKDQYAQMSPEDRLAVINGAYQKEQKEGRIPIGGQLLDRMVFAELNGVEIGNLQYKNDLYANIERLADPTSGEDAAAYEAKRFQELSEGLNHFQKKGLQSVRDKVRENFLYEASRKYAANLNAQANQSAGRGIYEIADTIDDKVIPDDVLADKNKLAVFRDNLKKERLNEINLLLDTYYNDKTGRYISADDRAELIYKAYQNKAEDLARDGRIEEALILLDDLNNLKAGQDSVYNMRRSEIQALKDSLPALEDVAYNREIKEQNRKTFRINKNSTTVKSIIVNELLSKEELSLYDPNDPENMEDIMSRLRERGVSEDELLETAQDVATKIIRYGKNTTEVNDDNVVAEVRKMIRGGYSFEAIEARIDDAQENGQITAKMALDLSEFGFRFKGEEKMRDDIATRVSFGPTEAIDTVTRLIETDNISDAITNPDLVKTQITSEIIQQYEQITNDVIEDENFKGKTPREQAVEISKRLREYTNTLTSEIYNVQEGKLSSSSNQSIITLQQDKGKTSAETMIPPIDLEPEDKGLLGLGIFTSPFRNRYFEHTRDYKEITETTDPTELRELKLKHKEQTKDLYNLALERVKTVRGPENPTMSPIEKLSNLRDLLLNSEASPEDIKEYFQAKSIVGLTLKELQEGKTDLGVPIPENLKDPMYVIMVADFKGNPEDLSDTDVQGLLEFLPDEIRQRYVGKEGIKLLVKHQGDRLTRYR